MADESVRKVMTTLFWTGLAVFWVAGPIRGLQQETPALVKPAPALADSLSRAYQLLGEDKLQEARSELERAQTLAGGPCGECLLGMAYVYSSEKDWKQTKETLHQAIALLRAPALVARAYNLLGTTAFQSKEGHGEQEAEDAFRRAASLGGSWGMLGQYNLAELLLTTERWAEAAEAAQAYLADAGPKGTALDRARIVLCRARGHLPEDPAPASTDSGILQVRGEVKHPEALFQTKPAYTEEARKAKVKGSVIVEAIIDQEGCVRDVRPLRGLPLGLTESTERAIRQWVFKPATLEGKPVKVSTVLTTSFQVQ